jgi:hypothetical protein
MMLAPKERDFCPRNEQALPGTAPVTFAGMVRRARMDAP